MRIVIDPGHGGKDPGAVNSRLKIEEADVALYYAKMLRSYLQGNGHQAMMTREDDTYISLERRVEIAHEFEADLFLSLHCNAALDAVAEGIEVWTSVGQMASDRYATFLYRQIEQTFPDRKMRQDTEDGDPDREYNFYVLRKTRCPAALLELGFITNDAEAIWLRDFSTMTDYCGAIAASISKWDAARNG